MTTTAQGAIKLSRRIGVPVLAIMIAAEFLSLPTPVRADPPRPSPSSCSQYGFDGDFIFGPNGVGMVFNSHGTTAAGNVSSSDFKELGHITSGGIQGRNVDFTIVWDKYTAVNGKEYPFGIPPEHFSGVVGDDANVYGTYTLDTDSGPWHSGRPLVCLTSTAPPPPLQVPQPDTATQGPAPQPASAAARLTISASGPTTLAAGLAGTYTVNVANNGGAGASAEVFITFAGKLDQTDAITPSGGFDCDVRRGDPGVNATVRCTVQQVPPKTPLSIVVHGRGMTSGAGQLVAIINSDPGVQFDNKTQQLNTSIT